MKVFLRGGFDADYSARRIIDSVSKVRRSNDTKVSLRKSILKGQS
jgi:hypothetical protein